MGSKKIQQQKISFKIVNYFIMGKAHFFRLHLIPVHLEIILTEKLKVKNYYYKLRRKHIFKNCVLTEFRDSKCTILRTENNKAIAPQDICGRRTYRHILLIEYKYQINLSK